MPIWNILGIVAIIALIISFRIGKNAIWGSLTIGAVIIIVYGLYIGFQGKSFDWEIAKRIAIICVLSGAFFETIGRAAKSRVK